MKEYTFLVWNTARKSMYKEISELAKMTKADFIILIESDAIPSQMISNLTISTGNKYYYSNNKMKFSNGHLYSLFDDSKIRNLTAHPRYIIKEVRLPETNFNLCILHLPSKNNWGNSLDHDSLCTEINEDINHYENINGHKKSIITGDFNMNPFDNGIINAKGLHSVMDRKIAEREKRSIYEKDYHFFYNPMWSFYGVQGKSRLNGTNYFNSSKFVNYYWNMYDQVLVRPKLLENFEDNDVQIIEHTLTKDLTYLYRNEIRIDTDISDHLPITFKLNFK